jgi:transketolase
MNEAKFMHTREAYGKTLVELGRKNKDVVVLDADLSSSTKTGMFGKEFPERFFNLGVAEANMVSMAGGLASCGKIAFASTFSVFGTEKGLNQFKQSVVFPKLNVKLVVTHGGMSVGADGVSHFCIEDIAIMRSLPNLVVVLPADAIETEVATRAIAEYNGPVFMRLSRPKTPLIYEEGYRYAGKQLNFQIGRGVSLREGEDVTIIATGLMVHEALVAASNLAREGVSADVINLHTVKPLDQKAVLEAARKTGAVVTAEEHSVIGGLGGAVAELLAENFPVPVMRVGIRDVFGESGPWKELFTKYGLTASEIENAAKEAIRRKRR